MKIIKLLLAITVIGFAACKQNPVEPPKNKDCSQKGTFEAAVCGWGAFDEYWIRLEDGTFLRPCDSDIKIDKNKIFEGRKVEVGYVQIPENSSKCASPVLCLAYPGEHLTVKVTCLNLLGDDKSKPEESKCKYENEGVLYNWTGKLDGCGWVIKMNDGTTIEVVNTDIEATGLTDGTAVLFDYQAHRMASVCMVGIPASITCIKAKPSPEKPKCKYQNQGILRNNGTCWMIEGNNGEKFEVVEAADVESSGIESGTPVLFDYSAMRIKGNCMPSIPARIWCIKVANTTF